MKVADPRAAGRHIYICDFCGLSSLGIRSHAFPGLVVAENNESCICGVCADRAAGLCAKASSTAPAPAPAQEPGHA